MHIDRSKPVKWFADMVDLANAQEADLIVLPGDIIDDRMEAVLPQAGELKRLKSRYGIYFSPGNHEFYNGLVEIQWYLQKAGFIWLSENGRNVEGLPLYIAGIPDGPRQRTQTQYPHLLRDADPAKVREAASEIYRRPRCPGRQHAAVKPPTDYCRTPTAS